MTLEQIRKNLEYYGLTGEDLEACAQEYFARQQDGMAPDLAEYAEAWMAL